MNLRAPSRLAAFTLAVVIALVASGCSSSSADPSGDGGSGAADCGAIGIIPPIVTVVSATGAPIDCDATFLFPDPSDPGVGASLCTASIPIAGCPAAPTDGAAPPCAYVLGLGPSGTSSAIEVSQPGFVTAAVPTIRQGYDGCEPYLGATSVTVTLEPAVADASVDGP